MSFVVTGAASGIGRDVVKQLLERSATVHALDITAEFDESQYPSGKNLWLYQNADVSSRAAMAQAFDQILSRSPTIHGLVHCAGILRGSSISAESDDVLELLLNNHIKGTWNACTEFYRCVQKSPEWTETGKAAANTAVVNIGSQASLRGIPGLAAYTAAKHGVLGLSRALAEEMGPMGIRVNCVAPGYVATPMTADLGRVLGTEDQPPIPAQTCLPSDIANAILFLLDDNACCINGQVLEVAGRQR